MGIDSHHIALVKQKKSQFFIEHLRTVESHVKPLDILRPILHRKSHRVVSGLSTGSVILRRMQLKLKSKREILAALPFQLEEYLPFPSEELLVIPTLHIGKEQSDIDLFATTEKELRDHLDKLSQIGVDPDVVSAKPLALLRFAQHLYPEHASLLVYSEKNETLIVMKDRALIAFQTVRKEDLPRGLAFVQKKHPEIEQILVIGTTFVPTSLQQLKVENEDWIPYAIAIGLALDGAKKDTQSRQFRTHHLRPAKALKGEKRKKWGFFAASLLFCTATVCIGQNYLKTQEAAFLTEMDLDPSSSLQEIALDLHSKVRKKGKSSLSIPNIPRVHEVLDWLSQHPKLKSEATLTRLSYQLPRVPRLGTQSTSYSAKLELELSTKLPRVARQFYDALASDRTMVDQKREIQFSSDQDVYRICFHLKPKKL